MNSVISIVGTVVAAYALIVLAMFVLQPRLIFFPNLPSRALGPGPDSIGLDYESVEFRTGDGVRLHGWWVPAAQPRAVLLFFHGNAGNISHRLDSLQIFHELGLSTLIFDYRGYGQSEGAVSEKGTYRDAEAAWRHLTDERGIAGDRIVLFGRSLGAAIAAQLASRRRPAGLILESGFVSVPDLAQQLYPWLPARYLARFRYPAGSFVEQVSCPVLIVHSRDDEIIPFTQGQTLFERAPQPKRFLELNGGHNDGFLVNRARYVAGLDAFLDSLEPGRPAQAGTPSP